MLETGRPSACLPPPGPWPPRPEGRGQRVTCQVCKVTAATAQDASGGCRARTAVAWPALGWKGQGPTGLPDAAQRGTQAGRPRASDPLKAKDRGRRGPRPSTRPRFPPWRHAVRLVPSGINSAFLSQRLHDTSKPGLPGVDRDSLTQAPYV